MIHATAIVDPAAELASDVEVGAYSMIGAGVHVEAGCWIGPHVVINGPTRIGAGTRIYQFASVGEAPQDLKYHGEPTELIIGERNTIRESATLSRGTVHGGGVTRIGDDNLIMAYVHVAHDCHVGNGCIFSNNASLAGHVEVGDFAILGGFTGVHQFSKIGSYSFSGMYSVINRDVPPYVLVSGHFARAVSLNKVGLKRRGFSEETIAALHKTFRMLVKAKGKKALSDEFLALRETHSEVDHLMDFIAHSERGIVRG